MYSFVEYAFNLLLNLRAIFALFDEESVKLIDLRKIFCTNIITRPNPNSTAESTRKKNVKDRRFRLS